jgi:predicted metalloprotease with PDZ domain
VSYLGFWAAITTVLHAWAAPASVAASSFDAWIKFYRSDENTPNAVVSYYAKGSVVALALDLVLRCAGSSLDAVMRTLWQRFGQAGVGVPEGAIAGIAGEHARRDLTDFFSRYVDGTEDPPLAALLADVGVTLNVRAAAGDDDRGGKPGKTTERGESSSRPWLGAKLAGATEARLQHVYSGGRRARGACWRRHLDRSTGCVRRGFDRQTPRATPPWRTVSVHAFRRDELVLTDLTLGLHHSTRAGSRSPRRSTTSRARDVRWLALLRSGQAATTSPQDSACGGPSGRPARHVIRPCRAHVGASGHAGERAESSARGA